MSEFVIRPMCEADVARVAELERCCFSAPWSEASVRGELENPLSFWLVAESGGNVVAYVGSQTVLDESDVMNVAVAPEARRQGIAQALLQRLFDALLERGSKSLTLEVRAGNAAAIALYTKLGFVQIGLRKNYYHNPREDALVLRRDLEEGNK